MAGGAQSQVRILPNVGRFSSKPTRRGLMRQARSRRPRIANNVVGSRRSPQARDRAVTIAITQAAASDEPKRTTAGVSFWPMA